MKVTPGRLAAFEVVTRVRERKAYAHETLDAVLAGRELTREDAAFATRLAYETVASRGTVDDAVAEFVSRPNQLEPKVADALALSAAEILFLSTPKHAAVNQGVELVREVRPAASRMANAVLRRIAERAADFPWGDPKTDDAAFARLYRHPLWMAVLWIEERGRERAAALMAANNEPAPLFVSGLQGVVESERGLAALLDAGMLEPATLPGVHRATQPHKLIASEEVRTGAVLVIDEAARFASDCVPVAKGGTVVEVGAGRGTKSLLLGARAREVGAQVTAVDLHAFKLEKLQAAASHHDLPVETVVADGVDLPTDRFASGSFDAVLVDAPCSGLGTLRRHPDRRWSAQSAEIAALAGLGSALLAQAARLVRPGGFVVYSTCTIARAENEDVVLGFLESEQGTGFRIDRLDEEVPPGWEAFLTDEGFFQSLPSSGGPDGHFVARLVRD